MAQHSSAAQHSEASTAQHSIAQHLPYVRTCQGCSAEGLSAAVLPFDLCCGSFTQCARLSSVTCALPVAAPGVALGCKGAASDIDTDTLPPSPLPLGGATAAVDATAGVTDVTASVFLTAAVTCDGP